MHPGYVAHYVRGTEETDLVALLKNNELTCQGSFICHEVIALQMVMAPPQAKEPK